MIPANLIEDIKQKANIYDVVSDFISLKKSGAGYFGCCPFHNERTASFSVSTNRNSYKCFGCGESGDSVKFVMKHEGMEFLDAIRYLANKYKIPVTEIDEKPSAEKQHYESLKVANEWAAKWFHKKLKSSKAEVFLGSRQIPEGAVKHFGIGFCPENGFAEDAKKAGYSSDIFVELGIRGRNDDREYDFFRGRVIYPITHPTNGSVIAFAGRTLMAKAEIEEYEAKHGRTISKFTNSHESIIYSKYKVLYNFFDARNHITKADRCYLVEGYHDVISMWLKGWRNVTAPCGTALTDAQLDLIWRRTHNLCFMMDPDAAGQKATIRGIELALKKGFSVTVVKMPEGEDPDLFARNRDKEEIASYIAFHEKNFVQWMSEKIADKSSNTEERTKGANKIADYVAVIPDEIYRAECAKDAARILDIDIKTISKKFKHEDQKTVNGLFGLDDEAKEAIVKKGKAQISFDARLVIEKRTNEEANVIGITNENFEPDELLKITKSIYVIDEIDPKIYDDNFDETLSVKALKKLVSVGIDVIVITDSSFDLNTGVTNELQSNFIEFYILNLAMMISPVQKSRIIALERSAEIISFLSPSARMTYIDHIKVCLKNRGIKFSIIEFNKILKTYTKENSQVQNVKKEITIQIDNPQNLSKEQLEMLNEYGLYYNKNQIFFETKDMGLKAYSNFILEPLLHTLSVNNTQKVFKMTNIFGHESMVSVTTETLNSLDKFCSKLEEKGNFRFDGNKYELKKLKGYLMDRTVYSYEIYELGMHRDGFWAWADGISTLDGEFHHVNEYGLVDFNSKSYYLKPFSKLYADDASVFANEKRFKYSEGEISLKTYVNEYTKVFGKKSALSICGYLTALFSDFIFSQKGKIPVFNLFGPKGTGKTEQATSLQYLFFKELPDIINISSSTPYASSYMLKLFTNAITVIDEYKNNIGPERVEFLKKLYNRQGRVRGSIKEGVDVEKIPVNSMVYLCGQEMPTVDVALLSRCIFISNYKDSHSIEEKEQFNNFQELCRNGLSHITAELIVHRPTIIEQFNSVFAEIEEDLKTSTKNIESRIIENYSIVLTPYKILSKFLGLNFSFADVRQMAIECINEQQTILRQSNELANFWSLFTYLVNKGELRQPVDFKIVDVVEIDLLQEIGGKLENTKLNFGAAFKNMLFLKWSGLYPLIAKTAKSSGIEIIPEHSLEFYITHTNAFIGKKKSVRFQQKVTQAFVFDYELLNLDINETDAAPGDEGYSTYKPNSDEELRQKEQVRQTRMKFPAKESETAEVKEEVNDEMPF